MEFKMITEEQHQHIFDIVSKHILSQGRQSVCMGVCAYRIHQDDGSTLKCAVGALIDDEHYSRKLEEEGIVGTLVMEAVLGSNPWLNAQCYKQIKNILKALQGIHDNIEPDYWEAKLRQYAKYHDLKWNVVNEEINESIRQA